jgi:Predicted dehydrogenases and related proteins
VDGVIITTPDRLHHRQAAAAIRAGYPVLLEKPAAVSQEEFDDLLEESERTGMPVSVCLVMRYYPFCRRIKEVVESGEIGRIVSIDHTEFIGPRPDGTYVRAGAVVPERPFRSHFPVQMQP